MTEEVTFDERQEIRREARIEASEQFKKREAELQGEIDEVNENCTRLITELAEANERIRLYEQYAANKPSKTEESK